MISYQIQPAKSSRRLGAGACPNDLTIHAVHRVRVRFTNLNIFFYFKHLLNVSFVSN